MPHAALWVVQLEAQVRSLQITLVSMPHAALWVVQPFENCCYLRNVNVSMPHAALWVVQPSKSDDNLFPSIRFNAARGFVGGATK